MDHFQNTVQFLLDDKIKTIDFSEQGLSPTLTVLNYLRSLPNHKGVKEGCAEGDCGACTIVVGELNNNGQIEYKAVNSCLIFLPMLHGKQLITIENLAVKRDNINHFHPVQKAIIDLHGSQCGFCTPGIVMSMFALYKNHNTPSREIIEDSLTGNLCRCTGYESIIKAAKQACSKKGKDQFSKNEPSTINLLSRIKNNPIYIKNSGQHYWKPINLNQTYEILEGNPDAIIINGSTDAALKQTKNFEILEKTIDLSSIIELKSFSEENNTIFLGSGLSLQTIKSNLDNQLPAFSKMLSVFASKQIREVATLGGNVGTASPIGDALLLLIAYRAHVKLISKNGIRKLAIEEFITGYRQTDLKKSEVIHSIEIPKNDNRTIDFYKISKRKDLDISTVSAGFSLELKENKVIHIFLAFGGLAKIPKRAIETEAYLLNKSWTHENIEKAIKILTEEFTPISDARAGANFRKLASGKLLMKFYSEHPYE